MKYVAIIMLTLVGLIELIVRPILLVATCCLVLLSDGDFVRPWAFQMAEKVLRS